MHHCSACCALYRNILSVYSRCLSGITVDCTKSGDSPIREWSSSSPSRVANCQRCGLYEAHNEGSSCPRSRWSETGSFQGGALHILLCLHFKAPLWFVRGNVRCERPLVRWCMQHFILELTVEGASPRVRLQCPGRRFSTVTIFTP